MILQLEPDILECEVKWALEASLQTNLVEIKEFQLSKVKSLKMLLPKCDIQYAANLKNSTVATGLEKVNFNSISKEKQYQRLFKLQCSAVQFSPSIMPDIVIP